jgi:hypothetical protein
MQLYYFPPPDYGMEFFIVAETEAEAREYLKESRDKDVCEYMRQEKELALKGSPKVFRRGEICTSEIC